MTRRARIVVSLLIGCVVALAIRVKELSAAAVVTANAVMGHDARLNTLEDSRRPWMPPTAGPGLCWAPMPASQAGNGPRLLCIQVAGHAGPHGARGGVHGPFHSWANLSNPTESEPT